MAIRENSTVKVIGGFYDGKTGKVVNAYPNLDVAVVSFDDNGDVGKVPFSALVEIQPQADRIVDVKNEIPEGAKKISRADFEEALAKVTDPEAMLTNSKLDPLTVLTQIMTGKIIGDDAESKIFKDQDVVITTEDQFIVMLWNACDPVTVAETTGKKMSTRKCMDVTLTAFITLKEIVPILFDAENG